MQKALLEAEEQVIAQDIIPDEPTGSTDPAVRIRQGTETICPAPMKAVHKMQRGPAPFKQGRLFCIRIH